MTRFYFHATATPAVSPAVHSSWTTSASVLRRQLITAKVAGDTTASTGFSTAGANQTECHLQYVSAPMGGGVSFQTGGVTRYKCYAHARESAVDDNATARMAVRIVSQDGTVVRAELSGLVANPNEMATALTAASFDASGAPGAGVNVNYTTVSGDRLVVELGHGVNVSGLSPQAFIRRGSDSAQADCPENETDTSGAVGWFDFTNLTVDFPVASSYVASQTPRRGIGAEIDGRGVPLYDWQADAEVDHGDRSLTGKLPRSCLWAEQGAPITLWRGPGDALWSGELTTDPRLEGDELHIRAHGHAERISELNSAGGDLPFYRTDGGERFADGSGDPFEFGQADLIDADAMRNQIRFIVTPDKAISSGAHTSVAVWIEHGLITRVRYIFRRTATGTANTDVRTQRFTGPSGTRTTEDDLACNTADGTERAFNIATPQDGISIGIRANANFTPSTRQRYNLTGLRLYGRTTDDAFSASDVVADVAGMAGLGTDGIQTNALAVLPLLWEQDHPALLDYMAELTDWRWLVRHDGVHFGPYERTWETATGAGAAPALEPQERSNVFVQPYRSLAGGYRQVALTADPDPFPGRTITTYGEELEDPQPDSTLATVVATAALAFESSVRMAGSVELTEVRYRGAPRDPVDVYAGDLLNLTDLAGIMGPQRITAVTYRQPGGEGRVRVNVQLGAEFNLVRTLREADKPRRRTRKRKRRKGKR